MAAWETYRLSDLLLFSSQTYYRLFELTNRDVWPLQVLTLALGAGIPFLALRQSPGKRRLAAAALAASWLWVAWAYHWQRYADINWAAPWFAAAFAVEALLLLWAGIVRNRLFARPASPNRQRTGLSLYGFALIVYPFANLLRGHEWAQMELFGIAPDPTAMATLGILLASDGKVRWGLITVPVVWCLVSGATLWALGASNALIPPLAAILAVLLCALPQKR